MKLLASRYTQRVCICYDDQTIGMVMTNNDHRRPTINYVHNTTTRLFHADRRHISALQASNFFHAQKTRQRLIQFDQITHPQSHSGRAFLLPAEFYVPLVGVGVGPPEEVGSWLY